MPLQTHTHIPTNGQSSKYMNLSEQITVNPAVYQISKSAWLLLWLMLSGLATALVITRDYVTHKKKPAWAPVLAHVIRLCERIVLLLSVITRIKADAFNHRFSPAALLWSNDNMKIYKNRIWIISPLPWCLLKQRRKKKVMWAIRKTVDTSKGFMINHT